MVMMNALACACGAGLPPPDSAGRSWCVYCGTEYRSDRTRGALGEDSPPSDRLGSISIGRESWHDGEDAARIPMTEDAVLHLLRQHFDNAESIFLCPHIPARKEVAARRAHVVHLGARERILGLYDASMLGTGDEGFLVTSRRLCWRNTGEPACSIEWRDFDPDLLYVAPLAGDVGGGQLFVGNDGIAISDEAVLDSCADAFHVLALSGLPPRPIASGPVPRDTTPDATPVPFHSPLGPAVGPMTDGAKTVATPPPAHTTSYMAYATHAQTQHPDCSCWHCHTPLYAKTPQCSFCGAKPKKKGWLRTG
jgi:hypothetical protein